MVETLYGSGYRDPTANPHPVLDGKVTEGKVKCATSHVQMSAGAVTASVYYLCSVPSDCIPKFNSTIYHDAAGTSVTLDISAQIPSTLSAFPLAASLDISAAGSKLMLADVDDPANGGKELWEMAGMSADPLEMLDIYAERTGAGTVAACDLSSEFNYSING